jgi:hypothetical protein
MDRRDWLSALGALGAGLAVEGVAQADHGDKKEGGPAMGPLAGLHAHFCGIHIAKKNPRFQIIAQHYCGAVNEQMHQCLLFDSCEKNARLLGVEYIISDEQYRALPEEEKKYWHPHTYEVLAGGLIAPGMTPEDEMKFMRAIIHTWGKTWHTWPDPSTKVPIGEPLLMWALTADGQEDQKVIAERDRLFKCDIAKIREKRRQAFGWEVPKVSLPKSLDQPGRQWTDEGDDKPTSLRR